MSVLIAKDEIREPLYAIVPLQNHWRWKSRWKHTQRAIKHFVDSGCIVVLIEVGFNRRELVFADSGLESMPVNCPILANDPKFKHIYIGLHSTTELWLKENMINVAAGYIPYYDFNQLCWLDSDVTFLRPNWVGECIHKLQHYSFLQMFSHARDLGPNYEMLPHSYPHANGAGFVQAWQDGDLPEVPQAVAWNQQKIDSDLKKIQQDIQTLNTDVAQLIKDEQQQPYGPGPAARVFPGLAWAATRKDFEAVGGLMDFAVWGGGDWHMSHALIGHRQGMMHTGLNDHYKKQVNEWADRSERCIRRNVGVMTGSITHMWHGKKTVRGYGNKHRILANLQFDPTRHLKRDYQGLWQLHDDGTEAYVKLRDSFRVIAQERNEDSNDL